MVVYKNRGLSENSEVPMSQLPDDFVPLNLTKDEINSISAFLENGLYDANLKRYEPTNLP